MEVMAVRGGREDTFWLLLSFPGDYADSRGFLEFINRLLYGAERIDFAHEESIV